jgi:hypothetical protein
MLPPRPIAISSPSKEASKVSLRIELLFSKFAAFYGHIWRSQFKDGDSFIVFVKKEWQEGLKDFTDSVVEEAVLKCRDFYEMPPTLPQVITTCRDIRREKNAFTRIPPVERRDVEKAKVHLKQCIEKLKIKLN